MPIPRYLIERNKYASQIDNYNVASEYGGLPGLIQPDPHVPTSAEKLMMIYKSVPEVGYVDGVNPVQEQEIPVTEPQ